MVLLVILCLLPHAYSKPYLVQKGDTLSEISHGALDGKVWGKSGSLKKILILNPEYGKNPDRVLPGVTLQLPGLRQPVMNPPVTRTSALKEAGITQSVSNESAPHEPSTHELLPHELVNYSEALGEPKNLVSRSHAPQRSVRELSIDQEFSFTEILVQSFTHDHLAQIDATSSYHLKVGYAQEFSPTLSSEAYFGFQSLGVTIPAVTNGSSSQGFPNFFRYGVNTEFQASKDSRMGLDLGLMQNLYFTKIQSNATQIDVISVPTLTLSLKHRFYRNHAFSLGGVGRFGAGLPLVKGGDEIHLNPHYGIDAFLNYDAFAWLRVESGARGNYFIQNTSRVFQSLVDVGLYLKLNFLL